MVRAQRKKRPKCCGKSVFKDEISAKIELARIYRRDDARREKIPLRAYKCEKAGCKYWLLTSKAQWKGNYDEARHEGSEDAPSPLSIPRYKAEADKRRMEKVEEAADES